MISKNVFAIGLFILMAGCGADPVQQPKPPNIILLSIDTLRADRLGLYGNFRSVSPILDRLSRQGHTFCSVISQSPLTAPSHMTMFTSRYPEVHQVRNVTDDTPVKLSSNIPTLAEQLKMHGYGTVACTDGGNINGALGFARGFDMYAEAGAEQFMGFIRLRPREPWFAFLHTYFVHDPYIVPHPYYRLFDPDYTGGIKGSLESYGSAATAGVYGFRQEFWETVDFSDQRDRLHLLNLYDSSIRIIDISLQALINLLDELELKDNTLLIITSDHGEEFFEHSRILHERLYSETLNVPLIVIDFRSSVSGHLIETPVRLLDLAPTILDYLHLPPLPGAQGVSLTAGLSGEPLENRVVHALAPSPYRSRMTGKAPWKYIFNPNTVPSNNDAWVLGLPRPAVPEEELYHIDDDPGETVNLTGAHPGTLKEMRELSADHQVKMKALSDQNAQEAAQVDENVMRQLQALGYVD
jgi:arylsulfatase A-like enzyme